MNLAGLVGKRFDQVPFVAKDIPEHHDFSIGLQARFFQKFNPGLFELSIVTVKTIGFQDEKNPSACMIANGRRLVGRISISEKQTCFVTSRWCDDDPALGGGKGCVFDKSESELAHIEGDGFIIIWNEQSYGGDMLRHGHRKYHVLLALAGKIWVIFHATVAFPLRKAVQVSGCCAGLSELRFRSFAAITASLRQDGGKYSPCCL